MNAAQGDTESVEQGSEVRESVGAGLADPRGEPNSSGGVGHSPRSAGNPYLIPGSEYGRQLSRQAGIASGEARRLRRELRQQAEETFSQWLARLGELAGPLYDRYRIDLKLDDKPKGHKKLTRQELATFQFIVKLIMDKTDKVLPAVMQMESQVTVHHVPVIPDWVEAAIKSERLPELDAGQVDAEATPIPEEASTSPAEEERQE